MSGSSGRWRRIPPVGERRSVWRNPPAEAPRTPCVRLWGSLRGWIPPRAWRADLGRFRGRFQSWLLNRFRGWKKKRGRRKKQDKTLAPQAPPGRSRLPAVRAVSGYESWRLCGAEKGPLASAFPQSPHIAGFSQMSDRKTRRN